MLKFKNNLLTHSFYLPTLLIFGFFVLCPLILQFYYGFFDWKGVGEASFVGFKNYTAVLTSGVFLNALKNNFIFFIVVYIIQNSLAVIIGIMLSIKLNNRLLVSKGNVLFRVLFFVPVVLSPIVIGFVFSYIFKNNGSLNFVLDTLNLSFLKQNWVGNYKISLYIIALVHTWKEFGYYALIFFAGMVRIPEELYEASEIDGANIYQRIWHITFPQLIPSFIIVSILTFIECFRVFDIPFMIAGGSGGSNDLVSLLIVRTTIKYFQYGYGTAISSVTSIFIFIITFVFIKYISRQEI
jgi:raffinose/stachyose/melibiose transport system permease protein